MSQRLIPTGEQFGLLTRIEDSGDLRITGRPPAPKEPRLQIVRVSARRKG